MVKVMICDCESFLHNVQGCFFLRKTYCTSDVTKPKLLSQEMNGTGKFTVLRNIKKHNILHLYLNANCLGFLICCTILCFFGLYFPGFLIIGWTSRESRELNCSNNRSATYLLTSFLAFWSCFVMLWC